MTTEETWFRVEYSEKEQEAGTHSKGGHGMTETIDYSCGCSSTGAAPLPRNCPAHASAWAVAIRSQANGSEPLPEPSEAHRGRGRPPGAPQRCSWCGEQHYVSEMRSHMANCPKKPRKETTHAH
jgi:hypothetical protein